MTTCTDRFLRACRRQPVDCTPVWFMRQAGRYMAAYQALRQRHSLLTLCKTPELAAEVTLQPIQRLPVDAAIIFTDLLIPLEPMGAKLVFAPNEGPVIENPIRSASDVEALRTVNPQEDLAFTLEAIRMVCRELDGKVPLIGFAGAPFTLASYFIEGSGSRHYMQTKRLMYHQPETWHRLLDMLAGVATRFLQAQIAAGAQVVQLFDSWVGCLSPEDYRRYVLPHTKQVIEGLRKTGAPVIHFGTDTAMLLDAMREAGGDVIGVDWRIPLDDAWRRIGYDVGIQGNLDPVALFAPLPEIERRVDDILRRAGNRPGHIFNLGHGILPETPVEHVQAVAEMVHARSTRQRNTVTSAES
ncbi:MAG: uroporphyrinogen decarboxylase [Candidatus Tectomicrobia bacterium]|nr:uroporphyrinogen decarboxylase [Candidatus Tectomicrobia bacterium]